MKPLNRGLPPRPCAEKLVKDEAEKSAPVIPEAPKPVSTTEARLLALAAKCIAAEKLLSK